MIIPAGHRLLVKPQKIEDVDKVYASAAKAGIITLDQTARQEQLAVDKGIVVSIGINAFKAFDDGDPWCVEGDLVAYARYGGKIVQDPETNENYIILNDEDVVAIFKNNSKESE